MALGFRVKSGWAASVILAGPPRSPRLCDSLAIDLCDPNIPATRQPYHAAMGKLESNQKEIDKRLRTIGDAAEKSIAALIAEYTVAGFTIRRAGLVVGSQTDPETISSPHIRAHALEGQLFLSVLDESLLREKIRSVILEERTVYQQAAKRLNKSSAQVQAVIRNLGQAIEGSWRARTESRRGRSLDRVE